MPWHAIIYFKWPLDITYYASYNVTCTGHLFDITNFFGGKKSHMYDTGKIKDRLKELRKERWHSYQENRNDSSSKYQKYSYCKSQEGLAEKIDVERRTIIRWESGKSIPSIKELILLCDALDCSVDYLLGSADYPEIDPISKASYYSKISPEIIRHGLEDPDFLDCLNFFMLPQNCSCLFNGTILTAWKKYMIDTELRYIEDSLKKTIIKAFNKFNAVTPFNEISKPAYKVFLENEFPKCTAQKYFKDITSKRISKYDDFIKCLTDTYEPLMQNCIIELQKEKLSREFSALFTRFISES